MKKACFSKTNKISKAVPLSITRLHFVTAEPYYLMHSKSGRLEAPLPRIFRCTNAFPAAAAKKQPVY